MPIQKTGKPEYQKSITSNFYVIKKRDQRTHKQGKKYDDKQSQGIKNPYNNK